MGFVIDKVALGGEFYR